MLIFVSDKNRPLLLAKGVYRQPQPGRRNIYIETVPITMDTELQ